MITLRSLPEADASRLFREGQDDFWLNLGLVFPHKDGAGFNIMLQAFPLDGKIVCREITDDDKAAAQEPVQLNERRGRSR
jgi:hypothetical protein